MMVSGGYLDSWTHFQSKHSDHWDIITLLYSLTTVMLIIHQYLCTYRSSRNFSIQSIFYSTKDGVAGSRDWT